MYPTGYYNTRYNILKDVLYTIVKMGHSLIDRLIIVIVPLALHCYSTDVLAEI